MNLFSPLIALLESMNPFALLLTAIATEICGTTALRVSGGFTRLWPSILVVVAYFLSFYLYSLVLRHIPMGVAYAVWAGLGTVGVVLIGVLVWRDQLSLWQVIGMVLVVVGAVMLNAFTPTNA
jgi:multidrug transporter EmrE-like cation transporter